MLLEREIFSGNWKNFCGPIHFHPWLPHADLPHKLQGVQKMQHLVRFLHSPVFKVDINETNFDPGIIEIG